MQRLTLAVCSHYFTRTAPARPGPSTSASSAAHVPQASRHHPSAGGLGAVGVRQMDSWCSGVRHSGIVADLAMLTARYRQPRSAYLPFLEAGHILENIALSLSADAGAPGAAQRYQTGPWLSDQLQLRILCLGEGQHMSRPACLAGLSELTINPTLAVLVTAGGLHAITTWPAPRSAALSPAEFALISQALASGRQDQLRPAEVPASLRERAIVTDRRLPGHAELARAGWHGAVPGWLGAAGLSGSAPERVATELLLPPESLRRAYARRRSVHVFDACPVEAADLASSMLSVHPEGLGIAMHLVLPSGGADCQVLTWAGGGFAGAVTRPGSVAGVMAARPGLIAAAGYVVLTASLSGRQLAAALVALGRAAQRVLLALAASGLASCPIHVDDDAAVHALTGRGPCYDPTYVIAVGMPVRA